MKHLKTTIAALMIAAMTMTSCSKEDVFTGEMNDRIDQNNLIESLTGTWAEAAKEPTRYLEFEESKVTATYYRSTLRGIQTIVGESAWAIERSPEEGFADILLVGGIVSAMGYDIEDFVKYDIDNYQIIIIDHKTFQPKIFNRQ